MKERNYTTITKKNNHNNKTKKNTQQIHTKTQTQIQRKQSQAFISTGINKNIRTVLKQFDCDSFQ